MKYTKCRQTTNFLILFSSQNIPAAATAATTTTTNSAKKRSTTKGNWYYEAVVEDVCTKDTHVNETGNRPVRSTRAVKANYKE